MLNTDYSKDEAFQDLGDLVEYEPTVVSASRNSEELLTRIAGGDYWKDIVRDYPHKIAIRRNALFPRNISVVCVKNTGMSWICLFV